MLVAYDNKLGVHVDLESFGILMSIHCNFLRHHLSYQISFIIFLFVVDASNSVNGGSCNPEALNTDTDPYKVDNDEKVAADCGSPTIISCKESHQDEAHHHETESQSLPQNPASGNAPGASSCTTGQSDGMRACNQNPDTCDTPESDKSFTFKIGNLSDSSLSQKSGKDWKQFPSTGPTDLFQVILFLINSFCFVIYEWNVNLLSFFSLHFFFCWVSLLDHRISRRHI